jgi:hypothetical protein
MVDVAVGGPGVQVTVDVNVGIGVSVGYSVGVRVQSPLETHVPRVGVAVGSTLITEVAASCALKLITVPIDCNNPEPTAMFRMKTVIINTIDHQSARRNFQSLRVKEQNVATPDANTHPGAAEIAR